MKISGNRTLFDVIGPNAQARLDRDVLNAPGAPRVQLQALTQVASIAPNSGPTRALKMLFG